MFSAGISTRLDQWYQWPQAPRFLILLPIVLAVGSAQGRARPAGTRPDENEKDSCPLLKRNTDVDSSVELAAGTRFTSARVPSGHSLASRCRTHLLSGMLGAAVASVVCDDVLASR
jgi:hypothetical protein